MMKIAYVTTYEARNIRSWSGTSYYIARALENQAITLEYLGSLQDSYKLYFQGKQYLTNRVLHPLLKTPRYLRDRDPIIVKGYARQVAQKLVATNTEIIFSPGTIPIAYLETEKPIAFWTDATFQGMLGFYPEFSHLSSKTIQNGNALDREALKRCKLAIYSSDWAAQTAVEYYDTDPRKVRVVPFGANLDSDRTLDDIKTLIQTKQKQPCKLLFLGVDWYRKGGNVAFEVVQALNRQGLAAELTVVGCLPEIPGDLPKFVNYRGFISKSTPEGLQQITQLLTEAHFLILPSIADCNPIALCEANAFGLPCLTTQVGGIPTVIKDSINGQTFSLNASITEYCDYISHLWEHYDQYQELALSSFNEYQTRLNWTVAGNTIKQLLQEIL